MLNGGDQTLRLFDCDSGAYTDYGFPFEPFLSGDCDIRFENDGIRSPDHIL
nr:hypothetical protein [Faecalibaculum rodentium]